MSVHVGRLVPLDGTGDGDEQHLADVAALHHALHDDVARLMARPWNHVLQYARRRLCRSGNPNILGGKAQVLTRQLCVNPRTSS